MGLTESEKITVSGDYLVQYDGSGQKYIVIQ